VLAFTTMKAVLVGKMGYLQLRLHEVGHLLGLRANAIGNVRVSSVMNTIKAHVSCAPMVLVRFSRTRALGPELQSARGSSASETALDSVGARRSGRL
jgi:hypothetical protein